jgi:hypothetical protein
MGLEVLLGLLGGVNMLKDISVKGDEGTSLYEIGARTKQSMRHYKSGNKIVAGVRFVKTGRELGIEYGKLGKLLTSFGYNRTEIGAVLDYLRGETS